MFNRINSVSLFETNSGPDPGFSVEGGRGPILGGGGFGLQCGHFSVKMYAKTKELGPVGGVRWARPPRSAYAIPHDHCNTKLGIIILGRNYIAANQSGKKMPFGI